MRAAAAALAALILLARPGRAATFDPKVDPRIELLGVVTELAGLARSDPESAEYRARIDRRFARFRGHPAVELYRELGASPSREEATATILLYFTDPPELALKSSDADIHYINGEGEREQMHRLLWELRDFARASDFMAFFREQAPYYASLTAASRERVGAFDPASQIEALLGVGLSGRPHYIVAPLAPNERAFILPYPLPPAQLGTREFEPYAISAGKVRSFVWLEPLYSFIDPSFYYFEKLNVRDPREFFGPEMAACHAVSPQCTKDYLAAALARRLDARTGAPRPPDDPKDPSLSARQRRYVKALSERLDEYERDRERYPTLWSFYPRLMSVYYELAHDGRAPARPLRVPASPAVRAVADFFDPKIVAGLK